MPLNESKKYCVSKRGPFFPPPMRFGFRNGCRTKGNPCAPPDETPPITPSLLRSSLLSANISRNFTRTVFSFFHLSPNMQIYPRAIIDVATFTQRRLNRRRKAADQCPPLVATWRGGSRSSRCWRYGHLVIFSVKDTLPSSG